MSNNSNLSIMLLIFLLVLLPSRSHAITANPLPPAQQNHLFKYCNEVQRMAKLISGLRSSGYKKADTISTIFPIFSGNMHIWIKPVSAIVYASPGNQEIESMKKVYGLCEATLSQYHEAHGIEIKKPQTQGF